MKRNAILVVLMTALALVWIGCSNPAKEAQSLFDAGKYEELVTKFGADPNLASVVQMAKDKIAEKLLAEGKFAEVLSMYATSPAAKEAKNKLAEQAFMMGNYPEVLAKYGDTPWAMQAKMKMDSIANATNPAAPGTPGKPGQPGTPPQAGKPGGVSSALETEAQAALDKIMGVKVTAARQKMLADFIADPKWAGTKALAKAKSAK